PERFDIRVASCSGGGGGFVSRSLLSGDGLGALFLISYLPLWLTDDGGALSQRFPEVVLIQGFSGNLHRAGSFGGYSFLNVGDCFWTQF
ncbi:hypothetical protein A2U01_0045342, partial [Trifolium medium]|nr:hypothetical protein [Trifolium medium]